MFFDEVGQSIPPDTAHVSFPFFFSLVVSFDVCRTSPRSQCTDKPGHPGCERFTANMEGQCWLRKGRRLGLEQNENRISQVSNPFIYIFLANWMLDFTYTSALTS